MPLHVLYVEDRERDLKLLGKALDLANEGLPEWSKVILSNVRHPSLMPDALAKYPDVVLADVFFQQAGTSPPARETDHLDEIIKHVREWDKKSPHGFPTPVIAYTGTGIGTLKSCLDRRQDLYDIWDKMSAGADYVAWRFQRLAADLPRYRPDATIQKLIAAMPPQSCPPWHRHVLSLVRNYGEGQTEYEQVRNCRDPLQSIINEVYSREAGALMTLWDVLVGSEPLLRAASPKLRGIARHSINVFWFGYWLINNSLLAGRMRDLWIGMVDRRSEAHKLKAVDPLAGLNAVWLLASFFHDAGKFHEKGKAVTEASQSFSRTFASLSLGAPSWEPGKIDSLPTPLRDLLMKLKKDEEIDPLVSELEEHIKRSWAREVPDHGAVAAAHLLNICGSNMDTLVAMYAREAGRAVLLHSCLPGVYDAIPTDQKAGAQHIEWQRDPVASLLLFCDQIQTWDRQNPGREKNYYPDRAELAYLEVSATGPDGTPRLKGCIDYITPGRVDMYPVLRKDIAESLNKVILEKPKSALLHVLEPGKWPFSVHLDCALSGEALPINMEFA